MSKIKTVFISDTHVKHKHLNLPDADLCCFSGDFMGSGYNQMEVQDFIQWLKSISHKFKFILVVCGNHDRYCEAFPSYQIKDMFEKYYDDGIRYIQDEEIELDFEEKGKLRVYGTPYQNYFCGWAWNIEDSDKLSMIYEQIPENLDLLITHVPPKCVLDCSHIKTYRNPTGEEHLGSEELKLRLENMSNPPRYHCFGHIHGDGGKMVTIGKTTYINASVCNEAYQPVNEIITLEIEPKNKEVEE